MENGPGLKMYFLLNMGIFHGYVSLPEGNNLFNIEPRNKGFIWGEKQFSRFRFQGFSLPKTVPIFGCHEIDSDLAILHFFSDLPWKSWRTIQQIGNFTEDYYLSREFESSKIGDF